MPNWLARGRHTLEATGSIPGLRGVCVSPLPKTRECVSPCPQGFFLPQNTRPRVVLQPKYCLGGEYKVLCVSKIEGACPHARRGFFRPRIHAPGCFQRQKYCFRSSPGVLLQTASNETPSSNTPGNPADLPDWCHQVPLRPSLPHAPGVRMTAITTNSLKSIGIKNAGG